MLSEDEAARLRAVVVQQNLWLRTMLYLFRVICFDQVFLPLFVCLVGFAQHTLSCERRNPANEILH